MKEQVVLGMDPAFRTGVKLAVVNQQGTVLEKKPLLNLTKSILGKKVLLLEFLSAKEQLFK